MANKKPTMRQMKNEEKVFEMIEELNKRELELVFWYVIGYGGIKDEKIIERCEIEMERR